MDSILLNSLLTLLGLSFVLRLRDISFSRLSCLLDFFFYLFNFLWRCFQSRLRISHILFQIRIAFTVWNHWIVKWTIRAYLLLLYFFCHFPSLLVGFFVILAFFESILSLIFPWDAFFLFFLDFRRIRQFIRNFCISIDS